MATKKEVFQQAVLRIAEAKEARKKAVWLKGHPIAGRDRDKWRRDDFGNVIQYSQYGNRDSRFGWEFDHIRAVADGGTDDISNLRPLHWEANVKQN